MRGFHVEGSANAWHLVGKIVGPRADSCCLETRVDCRHAYSQFHRPQRHPAAVLRHRLFSTLIAAIDGARSEVYFETYIFADDATGTLVLDALMRAAARGVLVCMILDWFGTGNRRVNAMHAQLEAAGVHHRIFNPWFHGAASRARTARSEDKIHDVIPVSGMFENYFLDYASYVILRNVPSLL